MNPCKARYASSCYSFAFQPKVPSTEAAQACDQLHFSVALCRYPLVGAYRLVGSSGLEPPTSCLSGTRSNHLSYEPISCDSVFSYGSRLRSPSSAESRFRLRRHPRGYYLTLKVNLADFCLSGFPTGGDDGIRTHDPLLAGQVLSQLSYTPIFPCRSRFRNSLKIEQRLFVRLLVSQS